MKAFSQGQLEAIAGALGNTERGAHESRNRIFHPLREDGRSRANDEAAPYL